MKKCATCKEDKSFDFFCKDKTRKDGFQIDCKLCKKQYYLKNKEKLLQYNKKYAQENKDIIYNIQSRHYQTNRKQRINYSVNYQRERKKTDFLFKLNCNIRTLIRKSIKKQGFTKRSKTYEYLGCTYEEFKIYLESKFTEGMNWENQGKWHLDHIYPVSLAKNEEEIIKLNHYSNFQPLWAIDNLKKGNKVL